MREIKFRVWNEEKKEYYPAFSIWKAYFGDMEIDELIVEQYIGLRDKNGQEIYEGDIVKTDEAGWIAQVVYDRDCFYCVPVDDNGFGYSIQCNWENFEVIGNIHEKEKENGFEKT